MTTEAATVSTAVPETPSAEELMNKGGFLFRLYIIDSDTDPDNPIIKLGFKRGDDYTAIQKRTRSILNGDGAEGDFVYIDEATSEKFDVEEGSNWFLAQVRKQKSGSKPAGIDKEWVRILLARDDLTPEQKMAEIAKYT